MFVLTSIKQTVRVPAEKFHLNLYQAIEQELNQKYANKVLLRKISFDYLISLFTEENILTGCPQCRSLHCIVGPNKQRRFIHFTWRWSLSH